ncbi:hypothetical protein [Streptomyces sp. RerS4]|uniref:hypothetical protein n=1 Tax=Streptomyces sp. RerS4 TaxID=2942449 RepID=UPI00201BD026|nr:hypothetical protein [Streptomyces sp. RerS4]UQX05408.1 hypothetical protein M4D82_33550 [Streptomyces sp. RerS4]
MRQADAQDADLGREDARQDRGQAGGGAGEEDGAAAVGEQQARDVRAHGEVPVRADDGEQGAGGGEEAAGTDLVGEQAEGHVGHDHQGGAADHHPEHRPR